MSYRYNRLSLAIALIAAAASGQAVAGAFQLQEQSVSGQGNSWAGRSSNVQDATIVFGNPAGMSFLDKAQISLGAHYIDASSNIDDASAQGFGAAGGNDGDMIPHKTVPFGYYVQPITKNWSFGLGVYAPFGLVTDYEDNFMGRYFGNYSKLEVVTTQPTLSYRFNDKFSIGVGITYNQIKGELEQKTPPRFGSDGTVNVDGDDDAWGYNIGMIYRPVKSTTLGLTYHSKVDYSLDGDAKLIDVVAPAKLQYDASLDITLPEAVEFSATHELTDRWTVMAGATFIRWSRFDELNVSYSGPVPIDEVQSYKDSWTYALGTSFQVNPQWLLRAGIAYDKTPIKDSARTVRVPSGDRTIFSLGAGWTPIPDLTIDAAYSRIEESSASVNMGPDQFGDTYSADYDNSLNLFGLQATYRF